MPLFSGLNQIWNRHQVILLFLIKIIRSYPRQAEQHQYMIIINWNYSGRLLAHSSIHMMFVLMTMKIFMCANGKLESLIRWNWKEFRDDNERILVISFSLPPYFFVTHIATKIFKLFQPSWTNLNRKEISLKPQPYYLIIKRIK